MSDPISTTPEPPRRMRRRVWLLLIICASVFYSIGYLSGCSAGVRWNRPTEPFEQTGSFHLVAGQEGQINFPIPYKSPPNVTIDVRGFNRTIITEATETGFKWKNVAKPDDSFNSGDTRWTAKGIIK